MLSTTSKGTLIITLSGVLNTGNLVFSKLLRQSGFPYFRVYGLSCFCALLVALAVLAIQWKGLPGRHHCKWVALRGFFGVMSYILSVIAVYRGTPMGDIATLTSVNMVAAAFLGRLLLGEPLAWIHHVALLCSLVGAVLISKPSFLFPTSDVGPGWLGYFLALASGFVQACVFISSRKSAGTSAWMHILSAMTQGGVASLFLPLLPGADGSLDALGEAPLLTLAWIAAVAACLLGTTLTLSVGSMWCPAAVSATVTTAVRMGCSYAAQALFFGEPIELLTLLGAGLMLAGVVAMAGWRSASTARAEIQEEVPESPAAGVDESGSLGDRAETESLASFIAAEFVDPAHHDKPVRQRRSSRGSLEPPAHQIGVMTAVATVAM